MLSRTRSAFGGFNILDDAPRVTEVRNAMVIGWALYDDRRLLVPDSAFAREGIENGRTGLTTIGAETTTNRNIRAGQRLPEDDYVWIGHLHQHFGHFLVSTVSRLWSILQHGPNVKLVTPGPGQLQQTLSLPFVATIFDALGVTADRFIEVQDGASFPKITVPEALLVENSAVHTEFSHFAIELADRIAGPTDPQDQDDRALFLSKHRLHRGVRKIDGEEEFAATLESAGVVVVSPETLTLAEQIQLWRRHPIIVSFEGSAGHNAIFVRNKKLINLSSNSFAPSNQVLIDAAARHQSLYLNCDDDMVPTEAGSHFNSAMRLVDPKTTAHALVRAVVFLRDGTETMRPRAMGDTLSSALYLDEPFGQNLSRGKPARMSSADPGWRNSDGSTEAEAQGAVSGSLSARYQIHTGLDENPWWSVDLQLRCLITEIRVFNRNDDARERARHIILSASDDGVIWRVLTRRTQPDDFGGGAAPLPWRWWSDKPFEARFVRLSLEGLTFLHLDQVEVFGLVLDERAAAAF